VDTRGYEKMDGYRYNGYPTDMGTGTGQIFIQRVGYKGAITRTLPAPLTSLGRLLEILIYQRILNITDEIIK